MVPRSALSLYFPITLCAAQFYLCPLLPSNHRTSLDRPWRDRGRRRRVAADYGDGRLGVPMVPLRWCPRHPFDLRRPYRSETGRGETRSRRSSPTLVR